MDTSKESTNKLAQIGKKSFENQKIQRSGKGTLKPVSVSTSIEFNKIILSAYYMSNLLQASFLPL